MDGYKIVALRKESVDRNVKSMFVRCSLIVSLSARRAWIEIFYVPLAIRQLQSLSARRAWIEMYVS